MGGAPGVQVSDRRGGGLLSVRPAPSGDGAVREVVGRGGEGMAPGQPASGGRQVQSDEDAAPSEPAPTQ